VGSSSEIGGLGLGGGGWWCSRRIRRRQVHLAWRGVGKRAAGGVCCVEHIVIMEY
jgi:hypothetical protein